MNHSLWYSICYLRGKTKYLVKWRGLDENGDPLDATWEPPEKLEHTDAVAKFLNNTKRTKKDSETKTIPKKRKISQSRAKLNPRQIHVPDGYGSEDSDEEILVEQLKRIQKSSEAKMIPKNDSAKMTPIDSDTDIGTGLIPVSVSDESSEEEAEYDIEEILDVKGRG